MDDSASNIGENVVILFDILICERSFYLEGRVNYEREDNTTCALPCYYQILSNNFSRREEEMTFQILNISAKAVLVFK